MWSPRPRAGAWAPGATPAAIPTASPSSRTACTGAPAFSSGPRCRTTSRTCPADFFNEITIDAAISEQVQSQDVNGDPVDGGPGSPHHRHRRRRVRRRAADHEPGLRTRQHLDRQAEQEALARAAAFGHRCRAVYVQRAGRKLLSLNYVIERDKFVPTDLTVLAERITAAASSRPPTRASRIRSSGACSATANCSASPTTRSRTSPAGHRHPIGGNAVVESVATIPSPDGDREELWLIVRRTINGVTRRYVEFFERPWEGEDQDGTGPMTRRTPFTSTQGSPTTASRRPPSPASATSRARPCRSSPMAPCSPTRP
jgi:hypothetical protein